MGSLNREARAPLGTTGGRLFVSLAIVAAVVGGNYVAMPGIWTEDELGAVTVSLGEGSVTRLLESFVVVELVAMLVPRWRKLRQGKGRGRLNLASWGVAGVITLVTALSLVSFLGSRAELVDVEPVLVVGASLAWLGVLGGLAWLGNRYGLLPGLPAIAFATLAHDLARELITPEQPNREAQWLLVGAAALAATAVFTGATRPATGERPGERSYWFLPGLLPLVFATALGRLPTPLGELLKSPPLLEACAFLQRNPWWTLVPLLGLGVALSRRLFPLEKLRKLDRVLGVERAFASEERRAPQAMIVSLLLLAALSGATLFAEARGLWLPILTVFLLVAIALDGFVLERERRRAGALVNVFSAADVPTARRLRVALQSEGIRVAVTGEHHRSLLHFLAPYASLDVLVSEGDREPAKLVVARLETPSEKEQQVEPEATPPPSEERAPSWSTSAAAFGVPAAALYLLAVGLPLGGRTTRAEWEPLRPDALRVHAVVEGVPRDKEPFESCEGVWVFPSRLEETETPTPTASSREILERCVATIPLSDGQAWLFEETEGVPEEGIEPRATAYVVEARPLLGAADFEAFREESPGLLTVRLTDPDALRRITTPLVGKRMAVVVNGYVRSVPIVSEVIPSRTLTVSGRPEELR